MSCALGIMVKTPALSPVKTRLARGVGALHAEAFHFCAAEAVASVAQLPDSPTRQACYWAVAEAGALSSSAWADLPRIAQGDGGLGERMSHVYSQLRDRHGRALLVGADAPQLTVDLLREAAHWLALPRARLVIGPACDGGFWLIGGNCPLPESDWTSVLYSRADTRQAFMAAMRDRGQWLVLPELSDVDCSEDLPVLLRQLRELAAPTEAQSRLACWLEDSLMLQRVSQ